MKLNKTISLDLNISTRHIFNREIDHKSESYIKLCIDLHTVLDINLFNELTDEIRKSYNIRIS